MRLLNHRSKTYSEGLKMNVILGYGRVICVRRHARYFITVLEGCVGAEVTRDVMRYNIRHEISTSAQLGGVSLLFGEEVRRCRYLISADTLEHQRRGFHRTAAAIHGADFVTVKAHVNTHLQDRFSRRRRPKRTHRRTRWRSKGQLVMSQSRTRVLPFAPTYQLR